MIIIGIFQIKLMIFSELITDLQNELKKELLFIDDVKSNIESARSEGIDSVQYSDYDKLLKECQIRNIM